MLQKKLLCVVIALSLLLSHSLAAESIDVINTAPTYTVSQEFISFASPVFLSPNLEYMVIDNETSEDVTAVFLNDTLAYYRLNDWTSIHRYLAANGYTIVHHRDSSIQSFSTDVVRYVSQWPIKEVQSGDNIHPNFTLYYNVEARISGSFSYNPNTGRITNITQATYSNFRFYPVITLIDADVNVINLSAFSSFTNYIAYFGCTFMLPYTTNDSATTYYLIDPVTNSSSLRLVASESI